MCSIKDPIRESGSSNAVLTRDLSVPRACRSSGLANDRGETAVRYAVEHPTYPANDRPEQEEMLVMP